FCFHAYFVVVNHYFYKRILNDFIVIIFKCYNQPLNFILSPVCVKTEMAGMNTDKRDAADYMLITVKCLKQCPVTADKNYNFRRFFIEYHIHSKHIIFHLIR